MREDSSLAVLDACTVVVVAVVFVVFAVVAVASAAFCPLTATAFLSPR